MSHSQSQACRPGRKNVCCGISTLPNGQRGPLTVGSPQHDCLRNDGQPLLAITEKDQISTTGFIATRKDQTQQGYQNFGHHAVCYLSPLEPAKSALWLSRKIGVKQEVTFPGVYDHAIGHGLSPQQHGILHSFASCRETQFDHPLSFPQKHWHSDKITLFRMPIGTPHLALSMDYMRVSFSDSAFSRNLEIEGNGLNAMQIACFNMTDQ